MFFDFLSFYSELFVQDPGWISKDSLVAYCKILNQVYDGSWNSSSSLDFTRK